MTGTVETLRPMANSLVAHNPAVSTIQSIVGRLPKKIGNIPLLSVLCLAVSALFFEACSVTEQTPTDVSQKFEEGIKGQGKIVPNDKDPSQANPSQTIPSQTDPSQANPSINSPVTQPAS
jgi:hypothetical protein